MDRNQVSPLVTRMDERQEHCLTVDIAGHQSRRHSIDAVGVCVDWETNNPDNRSKSLGHIVRYHFSEYYGMQIRNDFVQTSSQ